jgi:carbon-monoxide dehydrogenase large subunit
VRSVHAIGAYLAPSAAVPAMTGSMIYAGAYDIPAAHVAFSAVYSHTPHIGPYRGAGRPEGIYVIERLMDKAARQLKMDPALLRRRNFIKPEDMPHQTKLMSNYDSGHFAEAMDKCLSMADWDGFEARRAVSEKAGRLRGRGLSYFIESAAPFNERMEIQFDETGSLTIRAGTLSHGQGHETTYAQMLTEWLGVPFDSIRLVQGDTDSVSFGRGTFGSRSMTIGGAALKLAADRIVEKGRPQAAHLLEAAESDVEFADGAFRVAGTDRRVTLPDVARAAYALAGWPPDLEVGLEAAGTFSPAGSNYPNGCHICEVELDPDTGAVKIAAYNAIDDSGVIINPLLFEGQIHGGLAQGIGQALLEQVVFDAVTGQLLSGSFLDYCMPRADDLPRFNLGEIQVPCLTNPLGVKGGGESGTVGAPPTIILAILDALVPLGVETIDMPATPERVWRAIKEARGG